MKSLQCCLARLVLTRGMAVATIVSRALLPDVGCLTKYAPDIVVCFFKRTDMDQMVYFFYPPPESGDAAPRRPVAAPGMLPIDLPAL